MIFYLMSIKLIIIDFQISIPNPYLQVIIKDHYITKDESGVA